MGNVFQIVAVSLRDIWLELLCFVSVSMLAAVSDGCCVLPFYKHHGLYDWHFSQGDYKLEGLGTCGVRKLLMGILKHIRK